MTFGKKTALFHAEPPKTRAGLDVYIMFHVKQLFQRTHFLYGYDVV